ncbi:MAG: TniB family NTP-binding protein [Gammaproteobacteria bacterium]|uniref:TniB family NTP-binding protein n=1 Tax=Limnobacter sp. TaxID=2003368 RepID=UPI001D298DB9|nr:TniB family NTP-binding protein [Gammaproteobacteria bacterium]MBU0849856.1 TniB family NTP-binding protein [Gammaproteobacteria bacterium]MBU1528726.1 TniB family NTP-binding protein [Gammaproteobacteria bacterium]MBU1779698.1 TniB family NTP-binding protein [Gammaproteobacteria bacterium]MBU2088826.1 TniB family NTP-binding protein [Gammaproteobacteria bacterium]
MTKFAHLNEEVADVLTLPTPERIEFCQSDRWVGYTRATRILEQLDQLLIYPKTLRMPNLLVVGRSGNGKSSILERFACRHPIQITAAGAPMAPLLHIEMPDTPDESELWSTILWALGISHREKDPASLKKRQVKSALQYASVRLLVIDEFNNLSNAGKKAADLLAAIKGLSNDLKISIVAAGTQAAINALNSDPQMKSRFEPAPLDRWRLDAEYLRFLASYERLLPLAEPSGLATREIAPIIYGMCGETIGSTVKLLKAAACFAINNGVEKIDARVLKNLPWTKPGEWDEVARRL